MSHISIPRDNFDRRRLGWTVSPKGKGTPPSVAKQPDKLQDHDGENYNTAIRFGSS